MSFSAGVRSHSLQYSSRKCVLQFESEKSAEMNWRRVH